MSALAIHRLEAVLGGARVLRGVDLQVEEGSWVGVIGPNGAGKTTLLRTILGGTEPSAGGVRVLGRPAAALSRSERARLLASVPQRPTAPPGMRVIDYVLLGRTPHIPYLGGESTRDIQVADQALSALDLAGFAGRPVTDLSGGEFQRVVLARALAQDAPILLLDEPTSSLDVGHSQHVLALVDAMRRSSGLTVLSALHDLTLAAQFCDRLVMLSEGRVVAEGAAPAVLTEGRIREHFGAAVRILDDGEGGVVVIPLRDSSPSSPRGTMVAEP